MPIVWLGCVYCYRLLPARLPIMESGPAATTAQHLARFEFGEGGTKVLMVEWCPGQAAAGAAAVEANTGAGADPAAEAADAGSADAAVNAGAESDARADVTSDASHRQQQPQQQQPNPPASAVDTDGWEVSWPGKSTFLPAKDTDDDEGGDSPRRRVFFLLPPDAAVPATITISRPGRPSLVVKPLPAIFPEALDAEAGARGVLHTIWAKRRLRELDREMDAEMRANAESVGLEMALAERNWIVENFLPPPPSTQPVPQHLHLNQEQPPASPRSPISGRLADKLKGLRLATSAADLVPSPTGK